LLAAGTAYAAIPDANGVIRGCYNVLSGSAKIVDGNSCGLFERSISWSQTGPRGPAGANGEQGPAGPQGPAGDNNIVVGHSHIFLYNAVAPERVAYGMLEGQTFAPTTNGFCNMTLSGTMLEYTGRLIFRPFAIVDNGQRHYQSQQGVMLPNENSTGSDFTSMAAGSTTYTVELEAGHTYDMGVALAAEPEALTDSRFVSFDFGWTCKFGS
jgi:hypothetical protein